LRSSAILPRLKPKPPPDPPGRHQNSALAHAFAGTGDRVAKRRQTATLIEMPDLDEMTKGSARIALEIDPAFARYVYIEKRQR